jgi:hypothetical protein
MRSSGSVKPDAALRNSGSQLVPSVSPEETLLPARLLTSTIARGQSSLRRASASCTSKAPRSASSMNVPIITSLNGIGYAAEVPLKKSSFTPAVVKRAPSPSASI